MASRDADEAGGVPAYVRWARTVDAGSTPAEYLLLTLATYANARGRCWPSQETLAADCNMSDRSVRRHLAHLERLGLIERRHRGRHGHGRGPGRDSDMYQLVARAMAVVRAQKGPPAVEPEPVAALISFETAGKILGLSRKSVSRRVAAGHLTKVGRLVRRSEVMAMAEGGPQDRADFMAGLLAGIQAQEDRMIQKAMRQAMGMDEDDR